MSGKEVKFRVYQQLWNRWESFRQGKGCGAAFEDDGIADSNASPQSMRFFFSPADLPLLVNTLRARFPEASAKTIQQAERICTHRFDLLGYTNLDFGRPINWHFDPISGKQTPLMKSYDLPYLEFGIVGDSKIIWELNRHQHFVTLGKAYQLTRNEKFSLEFMKQFYDWQVQNPYLVGINWASALEVAFRTVSWLWARELFAGSSIWSEQLDRDLLAALCRNARFIQHNLSTYFSRNTHLLGEAVALFFTGLSCRKLKLAHLWQSIGWNIILQEAKHQVCPDGGYFERSSYYHTYALDMFLHARVLAARNGISIPESLEGTIESMMDYLAALACAGPLPCFGDDDGGRWFDPRRNRAVHLVDPLAAGAAQYLRADWKAVAGGLSEETIWLLGQSGVNRYDALPEIQPQWTSRAFPARGPHLMASPKLCLAIQTGPFGTGYCGHSHADALSLTVAVDGHQWLTDRGTFTYTGSARWREFFRGTAAHNTVLIDGENQAIPTAPFKWEKIPHVHVEHWWSGKNFDLLVASHDGYLRLVPPVFHRRMVFFVKPHFWLVIDTVQGRGQHLLEINWHSLDWPAEPGPACAELHSPRHGRFGVVPTSDSRWAVEWAADWHSNCYGHKQPASILRCTARTILPAEFATLLIPRVVVPCDRIRRMEGPSSAEGPRGFRYFTNTQQHWWILSDRPGAWQLGDFASDARLVYLGRNTKDGQSQVFIWEGSFLSAKGVKVVDLPNRASHFERDWKQEDEKDAEEALSELATFAGGERGVAH